MKISDLNVLCIVRWACQGPLPRFLCSSWGSSRCSWMMPSSSSRRRDKRLTQMKGSLSNLRASRAQALDSSKKWRWTHPWQMDPRWRRNLRIFELFKACRIWIQASKECHLSPKTLLFRWTKSRKMTLTKTSWEALRLVSAHSTRMTVISMVNPTSHLQSLPQRNNSLTSRQHAT